MTTIKTISKTIPFRKCLAVTEKAFAVELIDNTFVWIPKSVCYSFNATKGFMIIQSWIADKKGL